MRLRAVRDLRQPAGFDHVKMPSRERVQALSQGRSSIEPIPVFADVSHRSILAVVFWMTGALLSFSATAVAVRALSGTFSVFEEPVSTRMGYDKVSDHHTAGAEYIASGDMSCLMHQKGCAERLGLPVKFIHLAQILNGARE